MCDVVLRTTDRECLHPPGTASAGPVAPDAEPAPQGACPVL